MTIAKRAWRGWVVTPLLACSMLAVGCGDDDEGGGGAADAGDASVVNPSDGGIDGSVSIDGSVGSDAGWRSDAGPITDKTVKADIAAAGHDRFYGVAYDSSGNIYVTGQTIAGKTATDDSSLVVAKYRSNGDLDTTFGQGGYATKNVTVGAQNVEVARGIVVQADGKIVIAGDAEHQAYGAGVDAGVIARDTDIVLVRFTATGVLDEMFGEGGIVRYDLGTGYENPATTLADGGVRAASLGGADTAWTLAQTPEGKLVIHGGTRAPGNLPDGGARTDTDYTLLRLTANGEPDTSFATTGIVRTDFSNTNAGARGITLLADGSIVAAGYTTSAVLGRPDVQQPVLYKVKTDGSPDSTFGTSDPINTPGLWHDFARSDQKNAEAYGAALQGSKFVTVGYGPSPNGTTTDWVFFRFNGDGSQDKSFGTSGQTFLDPGGYGDNGRAITILPDNRVLAVGGARPKPAVAPANPADAPVDGMIAVLGPDGQPDNSFNAGGFKLYDLGGSTDFLWNVALSPNKKQAAVVGIAGSAEGDDDGALILLTLP